MACTISKLFTNCPTVWFSPQFEHSASPISSRASLLSVFQPTNSATLSPTVLMARTKRTVPHVTSIKTLVSATPCHFVDFKFGGFLWIQFEWLKSQLKITKFFWLTKSYFRHGSQILNQGQCGWTNVKTDDFDWDRIQGPAGSYGTGPHFDHTSGKGKFLWKINCVRISTLVFGVVTGQRRTFWRISKTLSSLQSLHCCSLI